MGADHANLWRASTTTGPGQSQEYYDMFGVMGVGSSDGVCRALFLLCVHTSIAVPCLLSPSPFARFLEFLSCKEKGERQNIYVHIDAVL